MSITAHKVLSYTIDDHPNPDAVYDWIRANWHDLGQFAVDDVMTTLKSACNALDLDLRDYGVSIVPDRGELIDIKVPSGWHDDIDELADIRLYKYLINNYADILAKDCPFTGVCYDEDFLDPLRQFLKKPTVNQGYTYQDLIDDCAASLLSALHNEGEYIYSDEGIKDMCLANEYEFTEDGSIY